MNQTLKAKILESLSSVLPITGIVLALSIFIVPIDLGAIVMFFVGAVMLIFGMGMFQLGAEIAMTPISEKCGMHSEAKGLVVSLPIDTVVGLGDEF